jgi:hypothetical protein
MDAIRYKCLIVSCLAPTNQKAGCSNHSGRTIKTPTYSSLSTVTRFGNTAPFRSLCRIFIFGVPRSVGLSHYV